MTVIYFIGSFLLIFGLAFFGIIVCVVIKNETYKNKNLNDAAFFVSMIIVGSVFLMSAMLTSLLTS